MKLAGTRKTTKTRWSSLFLTLLVLSAGACGDSVTGVDTEVNELLGTWSIVSLMFAPVGGGSAVDGLAGTASITFRENLTYTLTFVEAQVTDVEDGTFSVSGSTLTLVEDDDPTLDPNLLTITSINSTSATLFSEDDEQFDFNDDGEETPATLTVSLQKQS